ncbi:copper resistance CopC/CopD family protein [Humibacter ginsenosidimutans]|uniref:Copper transport protein n=1 Tax=Humibacter ginsenosidimutans TaxID=2599293 RepID=A0A5B8LZL1_9MICO|nr:copper resistance protein CopC [Humibacter ginsenosidimutans]QDZ13573.1 hypothetical protein FPZ11_01030 [Humibacter ginsenosidimutans]
MGGIQSASAHAVLVSSTPADGSRVDSSPKQVVLTFDENIQLVPGTARVLSSTGTRADAGGAHLTAAGTGITIPLHPNLPRGSYTVTWRVVSADTHIVAGSIAFGVRQPASEQARAAAPPSSPDVVAQTAQGFAYAGVILCFGIPALTLTLWRRRRHAQTLRTLTRVGWLALLTATVVDFALQGPRAAAAGWAGVLRLTDAGQTVASVYGVALICRAALLVAIALLATVVRRRRWTPIVAAVLAVGVLITIGVGGHAGTGGDVVVALLAATVHLAAMAVWIGGLLVLLIGVLPGFIADTENLARLRRWSQVAFISVVALILSGEYQAWRQIQPLPSLWSTPYGITLLVKLALVAAALVFALLAQRALHARVQPASRETHPETGSEAPAQPGLARRIRRSVVAEAVIVTAVVVVTTVLTALPPASGTYGPPTSRTAALGSDSRLVVDVDPTQRGPQQITITPERDDGTPEHVQSIAATLSSEQNGVSAIAVRLRRDGNLWRSVNTVVPLAGTWTITFDVSVDQASGYATQVAYQVW